MIGGTALFLVLLSSLAGYAYFRSPAEDPKLADLRQIEAEIEALQSREDAQPDEELVIQALRMVREEKIEALTDQQHAVLEQRREEQRDQWEQRQDERMSQRLASFFAMPQADRVAIVDKMIEASEARRKAMEANGAGIGPPGGGLPGGGPPGAEGRGGRGGGGAQRAGGNVRRGGNATAEQRKKRERNRLNRTTPEYRAQRTEFVRVVQERRKELGLEPASTRQLFGMYRQLAPPTAPTPGAQASRS